MAEESSKPHPTLALSTKLEEDFVSPLTAVRGALEILRDFPELARPQRQRFVETALIECARLEKGIEDLAATVYAAGQRDSGPLPEPVPTPANESHAGRIHMMDDRDTIEVDLSDLEFSSSKMVNDFYDVLDRFVESSGRSWYFVVNYRNCSIWPEAWVAFAHRGKKVNVSYSLGTVRYAEPRADAAGTQGVDDPDVHPSRERALAHIDALRHAAPSTGRGRPARR